MPSKNIYSVSQLKTALECRQKWANKYIKELVPLDDGSFEINYGKAFHDRLEHGGASELFGQKWNTIVNQHYYAYCKYWEANGDVETVATEVPFEFSLTLDENYLIHGYIDRVVKFCGRYHILDTKTTGSDAAGKAKYHLHSLQLPMYVLAAQSVPELQQYNIESAIIDITCRPGIRQKKNETDQEYLDRVAEWYYNRRHEVFYRSKPIEYDQGYLHNLASETMALIDELEAGNNPYKNRDSCYKFRSQCGYHPVCFSNESLTNTELFMPRKKRK